MSGRIALMVRGLPSIGIDEAVERFGRYYPEIRSGVFHTSPSFTGMNTNNSISFVDAKTDSYSGGQGLTKESMRDLRKLREDFENYTRANPSIYSNSPTSDSRAKLYRRVGFQQDPDSNFQVIDTRRIAEQDLPYVKSIDAGVLTPRERKVLRPNVTPSFLSTDAGVIAMSRLSPITMWSLMGGDDLQRIKAELPETINYALSSKRPKRSAIPYSEEEANQAFQRANDEFRRIQMQDQNRQAYEYLQRYPLEREPIIQWANQRGLGSISELNASDIMDAYYQENDLPF